MTLKHLYLEDSFMTVDRSDRPTSNIWHHLWQLAGMYRMG